MTRITAEMIKDLRARTGVGMSKCKEALEETHGDMEKAIENLRKAGMASAVKKEGRETNEGAIVCAENAHAIALLEVNAETDFVVKNEHFQAFLHHVAQEILRAKPSSLDALLAHKDSRSSQHTIEQERAALVQSLGENIKIARYATMQKNPGHSYGIYAHMGGKIFALVELSAPKNEDLAKEIAMHAAAEDPQYLSIEDVPEEIKEKEREIGKAQVVGKPENIVDKIVEGKLNAFYDQVCLLRQKFIKDSSLSIEKLLQQHSKASASPIKIVRFLRWKVGASNS